MTTMLKYWELLGILAERAKADMMERDAEIAELKDLVKQLYEGSVRQREALLPRVRQHLVKVYGEQVEQADTSKHPFIRVSAMSSATSVQEIHDELAAQRPELLERCVRTMMEVVDGYEDFNLLKDSESRIREVLDRELPFSEDPQNGEKAQ